MGDEEEEEDNEEEDTSVSILEDLHVPQIPIATHPSFEYSQDGFDNIKNSQYYTGECRDFWQNTEESIDYCFCRITKSEKEKKINIILKIIILLSKVNTCCIYKVDLLQKA